VRVCTLGDERGETEWRGVRIVTLPALRTVGPIALELAGRTLGVLARSPALATLVLERARWLDRPFQRHLRAELGDCDAVLVEDPFHARLVLRLRPPGARVVLTEHNVEWAARSLFRDGPATRILRRIEVETIRRCDAAVSVSSEDRDELALHGARTLLVPHGIDVATFDAAPPPAGPPRALFVGSAWMPNLAAAREIATAIAPRAPWLEFALVGACGEGLRGVPLPPNVRAPGRLPEPELVRLYREATYALVPLAQGGGQSVKAVEALAAGKVVLATSVGVRGIPFRDGEHGRVEDDLARWPALLAELDARPELRQRYAATARALGAAYDYRQVYEPYVGLIGGLPAAATEP
jgi:glycosyltransferase involved in cell wall biosynthesis